MAGKCCGHTHAILFIISTQILLLAFVLLLLGTVYYIQDRPKERDYAESTCRVLAGSYRAKKYKRRDHYYPTWEVQHSGPRFINATIGSNGGYPTEEYAQKALQKMSVGRNFSCWYKTRQPTVVQWARPSTKLGRIMSIVGGSFAVTATVLAIISFGFRQYDRRGQYRPPPLQSEQLY